MIKKYFNDLKTEFTGYNLSHFSKDLMAGLTVTAVALPLALAFGVSCGADAAAGLICAIFAGIIVGGLSGASFQISGPTGAMTAILITIVAKFGVQGIFIAGFLSGIILIIAAFLKLGKLVSFIPSSVIIGFTSGIAIIIALGQLDNFFGVTSKGENIIQKILSYFDTGFNVNWYSVSIAILVILIMAFYPKKLSSIFPSSLASIVITVTLNFIFNFNVNVVGEIPKTFFPKNRLDITNIRFEHISSLIIPAISIAALCMIESLLCGASAGRMKNEKLDSDRELLSQGIGNLIIPFFGGVPSTAAIARSSVAIKSGGQTRLTSIIHSIGLLASMFLLGGVMSKIPLSALAGVLIVTAYRMNDWKSIKYMFKHKFRSSILQFLVTMIATVVFDLTVAIVIGVSISILVFVVKISNVQIETSDVDHEKLNLKDNSLHNKLKNIKVCYVTGPLFFGSVEKLENEIIKIKDCNYIVFSMRGVPMIDAGAAHTILEIIKKLKQKNVKILFSGVQEHPKIMLNRAGVVSLIGENNIYWDAQQAIENCI